MSFPEQFIIGKIDAINFSPTGPIELGKSNTFTLTLSQGSQTKQYTIVTDNDNRVISATRITPGTSTWDKLKTVLANFFGTSNNARIVKLMNGKSDDFRKTLIESIKTNEEKKLLGRDFITLQNQINNPAGFEKKPVSVGIDDNKSSHDVYNSITKFNMWPNYYEQIVNNPGLRLNAIINGDEGFFQQLFSHLAFAYEHNGFDFKSKSKEIYDSIELIPQNYDSKTEKDKYINFKKLLGFIDSQAMKINMIEGEGMCIDEGKLKANRENEEKSIAALALFCAEMSEDMKDKMKDIGQKLGVNGLTFSLLKLITFGKKQ